VRGDIADRTAVSVSFVPQPRVVSWATRDPFDADEATQEAFVQLAQRPDVLADRAALWWLMTLVRVERGSCCATSEALSGDATVRSARRLRQRRRST